MDETTEVSVMVCADPAGPKYRVFETEYPEEGYVAEFDHYPTAADLKQLCGSYVEKKSC